MREGFLWEATLATRLYRTNCVSFYICRSRWVETVPAFAARTCAIRSGIRMYHRVRATGLASPAREQRV